MCHLIGSNIPELDVLVPTSRVEKIGVLVVEAAGEDFVGMSRENFVTERLDVDHFFFIENVDSGLGSSNDEASSISSIIDCMVLGFGVEFNVFHVVCCLRSPSEN